MKGSADESPKQLPTEQGLAEIGVKDFLYVDRAQISALYAQLFPGGLLTTVKKTAQEGYHDGDSYGSDVKLFKYDSKSISTGGEGIEHHFDASWSIPLEVLATLESRRLITFDAANISLGCIFLIDGGYMRIIDYNTMKELWEPTMKLFLGSSQTVPEQLRPFATDISQLESLIAILKAIPSTLHAHFLGHRGFFWSSLQASYLTIPTHDLTLKYGGGVTGPWNILAIVDALPDTGSAPDVDTWSAGEVTNGVLNAMHFMRTQIGRPSAWIGITPLMIYRNILATS